MNTQTRSAGGGMSPPAERQDPRAEAPGVCGLTRTLGGAIEWICIKQAHDDGPRLARRRIDDPAERHHFVNRYPGRTSA